MTSRQFSFVGSAAGRWTVRKQSTLVGEPLESVQAIEVLAGFANSSVASWVLSGITSNERYVNRNEKKQLVEKQEGLERVDAVYAALIPIRKSPAWWALTQDARREIFEEQSRHIGIGLKYLPQIARRLHHCRDVSEREPFDFLTWFEYAPEHEGVFENMLSELRSSKEWSYVDREVDIRLSRSAA